MKTLVIVESPAKCKKIEEYLGSKYKCIASFGHLTELASLKNIDIKNNFTPTYTVINNELKQKQITKIRNEIDTSDEVILATDDDREGEAIAWHICELFKLPVSTTKRIVFHEITEKAIQYAVQNPSYINMNIVHAQQCRQILDLLVGFTISPILWSYLSKNKEKGLSAGRCQTPALRLVYDNYMSIKQNTIKQIYTVEGIFTNKNISFDLNKTFEKEEEVIDFLENELNHDHFYSVSSPKITTYGSPEPFITSTLQQVGSNELQFSPKETMKYAQELYENGLITYMRTDNKLYSKEFIQETSKYIVSQYNDTKFIDLNIDKLTNDSKEAHEAIRVVSISVRLSDIQSDISQKSKRLYEMIWKRSMQSCMSNATYTTICAEITAYDKHIFKHHSEQCVFAGWKIVDKPKNDDNNSKYQYLLILKKDSILNYKKIMAQMTYKDNKLHYTEAKLVNLLEEKGIGRPSTFSMLNDKIQERGYVTKQNVEGRKVQCTEFVLEGEELTEKTVEKEIGNEKNKVIMQPIGILVIEFLLKHFDSFFCYDYTKHMEDQLDSISKGETDYTNLCLETWEQLTKLIEPLKQEKYEIRIDEFHFYIIGKHGPVIKKVVGNNVSFLAIKKDLDIDMKRLESGGYTLTDLTEEELLVSPVGYYEGQTLYIKTGKYGRYVQWGENRKALTELGNKKIENITYLDIIKILEKDKSLDHTKPVGFIREVSKNISIRKGQYGDYVLYKTSKMKTPQFIKLNGFKHDYKKCPIHELQTWLKSVHKIE